MSKYIKLDDAISVATRGTSNYFICKALKDLATIEASDEQVTSKLTELGNSMVETIKGGFNKQDSKLEVSEDAISRAYMLEKVEEYIKDYEANELDEWQNRIVEWIATDIDNAPSVVPDRPRGEWVVEHGILACDDIYGDMYHCSVCGIHERDVDDLNFCANCGAKMKGAE